MKRLFVCLLWVGLLTMSGVGYAATTATSEPPTLDRVKKLFREGRALFVKRMFASSLGPLRQSFTMLGQLIQQAKTPAQKKQYRKYQRAFLATLAIAYHWNKQYVQSYQFYTRCVAEKPSKKLVQLCRDNLPKVLRFLARLEIETQPAKARLSLSWPNKVDASRGPSPLRKWVTPGIVDVQIESKGCVSVRRRLNLQPGVRAKFLFHLQKPATCPSGKPANAKVDPGDRVVLGSLGMTPAFAAGAPPAPALMPQPFSAPPLAGWQIGLIVGGAIAGAALVGLGSYGVAVAVSQNKGLIK